MVDKRYEQPISIGGCGEFAALGGIVGASSSEQLADGSSASALAGARAAHASSGAGIFFAVCILRGSVGHERGYGWATSDGSAGVSAIPRGVRAGRSG